MDHKKADFGSLIKIMDELRTQCPWDREQTIHSLRSQTVEELYELTDALSAEDWKGICEELGDLLMHIVFYSRIAAEKNKFAIEDVIAGICEKLIARHPHIYGAVKVSGAKEVKQNWENLKLKEGKKSVLEGVPKAMPALPKAVRIQEKVRKVGFEWEQTAEVWDKIREEMQELQEAVSRENPPEIQEEMGDLLFSIVNYARYLKIDPEMALEKTNKKFIARFQKMEEYIAQDKRSITAMDLKEMDEWWNRVKKEEKSVKK